MQSCRVAVGNCSWNFFAASGAGAPVMSFIRRHQLIFRILPVFLLASSIAGPAVAGGALDDCWAKSENRIELGECLKEFRATFDEKLTTAYQAASEAQDDLDRITGQVQAGRALERAQMAFELYRNLECHLQELQAGSGTGSGDFFQGCWIDMTEARVAALRTLAPQNPPQDLAGTGWLAEDIDGQGVLDDLQTTLSFESDEQVSGNAGCNRYFGSVSISGAALSFGPLGATRMACPDAVSDQEDRFLDALTKVVGFSFADGKLLLSDRDGAALVRLSRND